MIVTGTRAHGQMRRRFLELPSGFSYHKGEWMESGDDPLLSPTMFLVEQPAGKELPTHWHRENQFQVVVAGSGHMGRHEIAPIMVHYAGAYSGYGPIIPGPEGVKYFTIRAVFEQGAMMAATQLANMIRGPKRQESTERYQPLGEAGLAGLANARCVDLIEPAADKLAAQVWQLPPGASAQALDPAGSSGQFLMVLSGGLRHGDQVLHEWETVFVSADEPAQRLQASESGAEVLLLQIPLKEDVYHTPAARQALAAGASA
ncbi:MAG TPA: hypothetical protein PK359_17205 [Burkholderiaceae bacterium]|nr:hypothetical protein [Burkholderiaceae bacterium]